MSGRAERTKLVKELRRAGFIVELTGSGHWKVQRPDGGQAIIMAASPNNRGTHKTLKRLESIGFKR